MIRRLAGLSLSWLLVVVAAGSVGVSTSDDPDDSFRSAQIEDPDGNVVQLFERLGES